MTTLQPQHKALSMLIHGDSKTGKSLMGASTPTPRLILDVESASRFLPISAVIWDPDENPPPTAGELKKTGADTVVVHVRSWLTAVSALDWLKTGKHPFKSVTVDSVSELQYRNVEAIAGRNQMKIQDWGQVLRETGGFVRDLRDLTFHPTNPLTAVAIIAMTRTDQSGVAKPHLQGQLGSVIPYLPDVCAYLYVDYDDDGTEVRKLRTRRSGTVEAGERVGGRIPAVIKLPQVTGKTVAEIASKNITFTKLIDLVFAGTGPLVAEPAKSGPTEPAPSPDDSSGETGDTDNE